MSTDIKTKMKNHTIVRFWGGEQRGVCLQVTGPEGYIQLTKEDALDLIESLIVQEPKEDL